MSDQPNATIAAGQRITAIGVKGSAAAGDTKIQILAGNELVAELYNNNTGFPGRDDMMPVDFTYMGNPSRIYAKVTDAPATSPINVAVVRVP